MRLSGQQIRALREGIEDAFPRAHFIMFLREELDRKFSVYTSKSNFRLQIFEVISAAEAEGWLVDLVSAAHIVRPTQPKIADVAATIGLSSLGTNLFNSTGLDLDTIVDQHTPFFDVSGFSARVGQLQGRVCLVELGDRGSGTGFLVGPNLVLTASYILSTVHDGSLDPAAVHFRFDFRSSNDGKSVREGRRIGLELPNWCLDFRPHHSLGSMPGPGLSSPNIPYCLVRLAEPVGHLPIGSKNDGGAEFRGWLELSDRRSAAKGDQTMILQHPEGGTLRMSVGSLLSWQVDDDRLIYDAKTISGSGGAPVFDDGLSVIGLHFGKTRIPEQTAAQQNFGIPAWRITACLAERNIALTPFSDSLER